MIPAIPCPLMLIMAEDDPFLPPSDVQRLQAAVDARPPAAGPARVWRVAGASHVLALSVDPAAYKQQVAGFLDLLAS